PWVNHYHQVMSNDRETLGCAYKFGRDVVREPNLDKIKERFRRLLRTRTEDEIRRGYTLAGPHRDDLQIMMNDRLELRVYGSQGQQRTAALALKLAMVDLIKKRRGTAPLLLLDDVFSEFDNERKRELLKLLTTGTQTIRSTTALDTTADFLGPLKRFTVESGVIKD